MAALPHQAPPPPSPQASPEQSSNEALGVDGRGVTRAEATRDTAAQQAVVEAKRAEILATAREKAKASFREQQGIPPAPSTPATPAITASVAPQVTPPVAPQVQPAADPNAFATAFTAQLNAQFSAAEQMRAEATRMSADADRRIAEAEAKLKGFASNPASFLHEQGIDPDQWQARLMNGGEPTAEERLKTELEAAVEARVAPLKAQVSQLTQASQAEVHGRVIAELAPVLSKDFPLVNALLGPEAVVIELRRLGQQAQVQGRPPIDAATVVADMERHFLAQQQALLQNTAVASKLGLSVKSPPVAAAAQSPQTLSNRVTSTVAPNASSARTQEDRIARGRAMIKQLADAGLLPRT